jgi:hypothetical protein
MLRLTGKGARLCFPLYNTAMRVAHESNDFFLSLRWASQFFNCHESELYATAKLLVANGWWEVITHGYGAPSHYLPIDHETWPIRHAGACAEKLTMPWHGEEQDPLGQ